MSHPIEKRQLYDADHGKKVLSMAPGLERLNILPFKVAAYDKTQGEMAFFDPARSQDFVFILGTKCLSMVPLEIVRWVVEGFVGFMSANFVALNLRDHIVSAGERLFLIVAGFFLMQLALSIVLKLYLVTVKV